MNALVKTFDVDNDGLIDFYEALALSNRLLADFVYYRLLNSQERNGKWLTFFESLLLIVFLFAFLDYKNGFPDFVRSDWQN